jgi:hypothetical protein
LRDRVVGPPIASRANQVRHTAPELCLNQPTWRLRHRGRSDRRGRRALPSAQPDVLDLDSSPPRASREFLIQLIRSGLVGGGEVFIHHPFQMPVVEHDHMIAQIQATGARLLYAAEPIGVDPEQGPWVLDSTTIDLCLSFFPCACFRCRKGAAKMHALLDLRGNTGSPEQVEGWSAGAVLAPEWALSADTAHRPTANCRRAD